MAWGANTTATPVTERAENTLRAAGIPVARDSSKPPFVNVLYGGAPDSTGERIVLVYVGAPLPHTTNKAQPPSVPYPQQCEALCQTVRAVLEADKFIFQFEQATPVMPGMNDEANKTTETVVQTYHKLPVEADDG